MTFYFKLWLLTPDQVPLTRAAALHLALLRHLALVHYLVRLLARLLARLFVRLLVHRLDLAPAFNLVLVIDLKHRNVWSKNWAIQWLFSWRRWKEWKPLWKMSLPYKLEDEQVFSLSEVSFKFDFVLVHYFIRLKKSTLFLSVFLGFQLHHQQAHLHFGNELHPLPQENRQVLSQFNRTSVWQRCDSNVWCEEESATRHAEMLQNCDSFVERRQRMLSKDPCTCIRCSSLRKAALVNLFAGKTQIDSVSKHSKINRMPYIVKIN